MRFGKIGVGGSRMKCPQRLAVNHQRDRDMVGAADTVEMILDVAECEAHLVEIVEVIDHFQFRRRCCLAGRDGAGGGKGRAESRNRAPQDIAPMHEISPTKVVWVTDLSREA